jgi:hypothetical protein
VFKETQKGRRFDWKAKARDGLEKEIGNKNKSEV